MADPRVYPTYYDTYSRTKKPFMKKQAADTMSIGPDMSATPGYVDPNLPLSQKYLKGPLGQPSFVTAPTKKQKDAMYGRPYERDDTPQGYYSKFEPKKKEPRYTDSLFPTLPTTPGINPYFDYEKLDWGTVLDRFGKEFLDSEEGGSGFTLKTPEQGANYKTVNWTDAGFTLNPDMESPEEVEEVYFNPTERRVVRAPHKGFVAPEGWISLNNIKPISPDVPEDFVRGDEPSRYTTEKVLHSWLEDEEYGDGYWRTVRKFGHKDVQRENPEWTTWSQTPDPVRQQYQEDLDEFEEATRIYEERQKQIDEFKDYEPDFTLKYDPTQTSPKAAGNLFDQAARLFENFNVPMSIDPISGKLIINNKVMNSIQDLRSEHRKLVGQTGVGTFDIPVGMDPASFYRNMKIFSGTGATYYYPRPEILNVNDVWGIELEDPTGAAPPIESILKKVKELDEQIDDGGDEGAGDEADEADEAADVGEGDPADEGHGPDDQLDPDEFGGLGEDAPGDDDSGDKIICTAMNSMYGFGGFRNAIWIKYSQDHLKREEYELGYHKLIMPLVKRMRKNKFIRNIVEFNARHRTFNLRREIRGQKTTLYYRIIQKKTMLPIFFAIGWLIKKNILKKVTLK